MKNLKFLNKGLFIVMITILFPLLGFAQSKLTVKWGIENKDLFQETKATSEQTSAYFPEAKPNDKKYRFINAAPKYNKVAQIFFERHWQLWKEFEKQPKTSATPTKQDFVKFAKEKDPYYYGIAKSLSPSLYFDFVGESKEYVLESIEVKIISFDEYKGGGFSDNEAWYDIELKHMPGTYIYPIDKKLRFTGSGRAILRFCSDNYYENVGLTPVGCYMISIKFNFLIDGIKTSVTTEKFMIDV